MNYMIKLEVQCSGFCKTLGDLHISVNKHEVGKWSTFFFHRTNI